VRPYLYTNLGELLVSIIVTELDVLTVPPLRLAGKVDFQFSSAGHDRSFIDSHPKDVSYRLARGVCQHVPPISSRFPVHLRRGILGGNGASRLWRDPSKVSFNQHLAK
jgi:hypothetical protein